EALGRLAARGQRAWQWVFGMYCSERQVERYRGSRALAATMSVAPHRVAAAVRERMRMAAACDTSTSSGPRERTALLDDALEPFEGINHRGAAEVGRELLEEYARLYEPSAYGREAKLLASFDEARGRVALFGHEGD